MTIKELAALANVSASTVSKIMNGKDESISGETRKRVLDLAKEYHYTPYAALRSSAKKSLSIAVIFDTMQSVNMELQGILAAAQDSGYQLLLYVCNGDPEIEFKHISSIIEQCADGLLWRPTVHSYSKSMDSIKTARIPYLLFNYHHPDAVNIDFVELSYHAVSSLIKQHHTSIGCLLMDRPLTADDLEGYKKCLFENKIGFRDSFIFTEINSLLLEYIASHKLTALFVSHYSLALELYECLQKLHYIIPHDISIVSLRDDSYHLSSAPKISSVTVPHYDFGTYIYKLLNKAIEPSSGDIPSFSPDCSVNHTLTIGSPYNPEHKEILVIGSINIDHYLPVETLPKNGKTVISCSDYMQVGGKGLNQAVAVSLLGHQVSLIGTVGSDFSSDLVYNTISHYGVNPNGVHRCEQSSTGQAHIFVEKSGESIISIISGANSSPYPQDLSVYEPLFEKALLCLIQTEIPLDTVRAFCSLALKKQIPVILKPSAVSFIPEDILKMIDYFIPNQQELNDICPHCSTMEEQLEYLLDIGIKNIIVTLGNDGCFLRNRTVSRQFPSIPVHSIDTTGASDAFISTFASYLLYGYSLEQSLSIANYAAALSTTRNAVIPSLADKQTIDTHIALGDIPI